MVSGWLHLGSAGPRPERPTRQLGPVGPRRRPHAQRQDRAEGAMAGVPSGRAWFDPVVREAVVVPVPRSVEMACWIVGAPDLVAHERVSAGLLCRLCQR